MNTINNSNGVAGPASTTNGHGAQAGRPAHNHPIRPSDTVEFSNTGRQLAVQDELGDVRAGLIDRVRSEIENGTYASRQKVDVLVERLIAELGHVDLLV